MEDKPSELSCKILPLLPTCARVYQIHSVDTCAVHMVIHDKVYVCISVWANGEHVPTRTQVYILTCAAKPQR